MSAFDVYTLHKQFLHLISTLQVSEEKNWLSSKKLVASTLQGHYNMQCLITTLYLYLNYSGNSQWRPYWEETNWTTTEIYGCMDKVWIKCLCCGHVEFGRIFVVALLSTMLHIKGIQLCTHVWDQSVCMCVWTSTHVLHLWCFLLELFCISPKEDVFFAVFLLKEVLCRWECVGVWECDTWGCGVCKCVA